MFLNLKKKKRISIPLPHPLYRHAAAERSTTPAHGDQTANLELS